MRSAPPLSAFYRKSEEELVTVGLQGANRTIADFRNRYDLDLEIGRGSYSVVHACINKKTRGKFAVKIIDKARCYHQQNLRDELMTLSRLKHPNIISLKEMFEDQAELYIVMERAEGGELFDRIVAQGVYSERHASEIMAQLLDALRYLHSNGIIHRDIKAENILLSRRDSCIDIKLSDFGIAKILEPGDSEEINENSEVSTSRPMRGRRMRAYTTCGTDFYVAPEILIGKGYDKAVDLWSAGVVLYIMLCGIPPFPDDTISGAEYCEEDFIVEFPDPHWSVISQEAKDFVRKLLDINPTRRLTAEQALRHPWIRTRRLSTSEQPFNENHRKNMRAFNRKRKQSAADIQQ